jgi:tetratricopeptide (TPR) repeat protein
MNLWRRLQCAFGRLNRRSPSQFLPNGKTPPSFEAERAYSERLAKRSLEAVQQFSIGDLAWAEAVARDIVKLEPDQAESLNLLGLIAAKVGYYDDAVHYFERVLKSDPAHSTAGKNLQEALTNKGRASKPVPDSPRYLVIRAWENGFWSDVTHVLGCLLLAEITGRIPVTHWDKYSRYSDGSQSDAFQLYFKPVSSARLDNLSLVDATYFPAKWSASNLRSPFSQARAPAETRVAGLLYLNRPETVVVSDFYVGVAHLLPWIPRTHELFDKPIAHIYRWLAQKYLHPQDAVLAEVESFHRTHIARHPTIAVHVRGLDKGTELQWMGAPAPTLKDYFDILDREHPSIRIFLMSDDDGAIATFRERYGERVIFAPCQRGSGEIGLHRLRSTDRVRLGQEVMIDVYLALRCDKFLGIGMSNVSDIIAMLKPWAQGACTLLGWSILRHVGLYRIKSKAVVDDHTSAVPTAG